MRTSEYILRAAVQVNTDLFTGKHHAACIKKLKSGCRHGFITNTRRFVSREEALEIAIAAGQKINKYIPRYNGKLFSEDLYEDDLYNH